MPLLILAEPMFPEDVGAERAVWHALNDQLPGDDVLFAGAAVLDGARECEIDPLVAWPGGDLAAIEVKGGHITLDGVPAADSSRHSRRTAASDAPGRLPSPTRAPDMRDSGGAARQDRGP